MQATMTPTGVFNDQMIAADYLIGAKSAIKACAMAIAEATTPEVRNTLKQHVNYPPPTLRLEVGASSDLCVFAER
ncbi:spore coat protein [Geobacillus sp. FSL K6-0789]|uniref:Spore coat protein n=5 Tax=Geobacillus TaxID=129337 RepID=A0A0K9HKA5_GEOSE|nr:MULTISPECIES: spore coat protein [Geobacillus]AKU27933.1 hypothetical protein IB49_17945 [Geobacillus sp. LC300]STO12023.1 Spore coat protein [[Flavobacterium] thermophilum]AGE22068.1 hypothetical protein GHH_c15370 [Geobacillus sp. GHH01]ATA59839.1 hypothetical protein GS458_1389 [Geobacillus stearothermophilus]EPR26432.1 putative spore coat protein [Geobacillus sp. WSUCF1]